MIKTLFAIVALLFASTTLFAQDNNDAGLKLSSGIVWHQLRAAVSETEPHVTVYFFRAYINPFVAPLKKMSFTLNDSLVYELKANSMISIDVKPGKYKISADKKDKTAMFLTLKGGNEYFFEGFLPNGIGASPMSLTTIRPEIARKEVGLPSKTVDNEKATAVAQNEAKLSDIPQSNTTVTALLHEAQFPGGAQAWSMYLQQNLNSKLGRKYIHLERDQTSATQTVLVSFLVDKEGNVTEVQVDNPADVHPKLAAEAVRVVSHSPKWNPAVQDGKKVIYRQKQAISFETSWQ
jgi:hypothetical protein